MTDSFLQSMTFSRAGQFQKTCDREECDNIPPSIRKFLQDRKRKRTVTGPIQRTQQRTLVVRHGQISIWCMQMPKNAEPLVDFGSCHRIVWVKKFATSLNIGDCNISTLRWIGKGIIGSSDEEKSRKILIEWTEGRLFLVPSNGGKAVGWIHASDGSDSTHAATNNDDDYTETSATNNKKNNNEGGGFAVLFVAKIPLGIMNQDQDDSGGTHNEWTNQLIKSCRSGLELYEKQRKKCPSYYKFSCEESNLLKKAILDAEGIAAKNDVMERASKRICLNEQVTY